MIFISYLPELFPTCQALTGLRNHKIMFSWKINQILLFMFKSLQMINKLLSETNKPLLDKQYEVSYAYYKLLGGGDA